MRVWLRHVVFNCVIGPLLMHINEEDQSKKETHLSVRLQTERGDPRFINIDGELSKKSEQFQFTKLVSLKPYQGKKSPTDQLTFIQAE